MLTKIRYQLFMKPIMNETNIKTIDVYIYFNLIFISHQFKHSDNCTENMQKLWQVNSEIKWLGHENSIRLNIISQATTRKITNNSILFYKFALQPSTVIFIIHINLITLLFYLLKDDDEIPKGNKLR